MQGLWSTFWTCDKNISIYDSGLSVAFSFLQSADALGSADDHSLSAGVRPSMRVVKLNLTHITT